MLTETILEVWDKQGIGNTLYGLDMWHGEPAYVVLGVGGPSGEEMLASINPDLVGIAEVMAIESDLAHDGPWLSALKIRILESER